MGDNNSYIKIKTNTNLGLKKISKIANPEEGGKLETKGIKKY
jgi:hypothetical protein